MAHGGLLARQQRRLVDADAREAEGIPELAPLARQHPRAVRLRVTGAVERLETAAGRGRASARAMHTSAAPAVRLTRAAASGSMPQAACLKYSTTSGTASTRCCAAWGRASCWRCRSASASPIRSPTSSTGAPPRDPGDRPHHHHGAVAAEARGARARSRRACSTPLVERVFGSYVEPEYARALRADTRARQRARHRVLPHPGRLPRLRCTRSAIT